MEKRVAAPASEEEEERRKRLRALCRNVLQQAGPVEDWSSAKVALFVKTLADNSLLGRGTAELSLADTFRKHGVHGRRLVLLDNFTGNEQLKAPPFAITSLGKRLKLLDAIKVLVEEQVEARVSAGDSGGAKTPVPGKQNGGGAGVGAWGGSGGLGQMIGRTCPAVSADDGKVESARRDLMATVPMWRSTAFPPSGWVDPGPAGRTAPSTELEIDFVFGYSGARSSGNLCCNDAGELIFPASRLAVVFNMENRTQRFFLLHEDEVSALAMHPDNVIVASGEHGSSGTVCVWDSQNMETLAVLSRAERSSARGGGELGVSALSFSGMNDRKQKGVLLAAVTRDMMVLVWRWKEKKLVASMSAGTGRVYAARINPYREDKDFILVTAGTQSVRFWSLNGGAGGGRKAGRDQESDQKFLSGMYGAVGKFGVQQTAISVAFLDANTTVTGMQDGSLFVWQGTNVCKSLDPAHAGPIFDIAVTANVLLSASHDGKVHQWSLSKPSAAKARTILTLLGTVDANELCRKMDSAHELRRTASPDPCDAAELTLARAEGSAMAPRVTTEGKENSKPEFAYWDQHTPCVRALAILPRDNSEGTGLSVALGMESNDVYLLKTDAVAFGKQAGCESLLNAHAQHTVTQMCTHPTIGLLASVGSDGTVRVWDLSTKRMIAMHRLWERTARGGTHALVGECEPPCWCHVFCNACAAVSRGPGQQNCTSRGLSHMVCRPGVCLAFSSDPAAHLCVGLSNGNCRVLSCKGHPYVIARIAPTCAKAKVSVSCCRYAPTDTLLAVASKDNTITIYDRTAGGEYTQLRIISVSLGGFLSSIDWSHDAMYLQV